MNGPADADDGVGVVSASEGVDSGAALGESLDDARGGALPEAQPARSMTASIAAIPSLTLWAMKLSGSTDAEGA